ncbi:hypothetical protein GCM10025879_08190 [Leuconostoc litchii]|uniref:Uncharacterized protein n=1 Tax=Leuconostoc litchii TaxID=1981069 RepID=A0A6P2CR09_9LACO|nr:hypothetical protein [Leuconostoc litchii]TYC47542.1 hypothetical protein ESZ47_05245 [Leuconostoc litchii]GMA69573.1 hypothetical protein GCM10025879_08190 [Leuconostoc litchii]
MIEKLFTAPKAGITDEEYHEKIKYQTNFWTSIIVLAVIITMILASLQNASDSRSFFHGFSAGIFCGGIGSIIISRSLLHNRKYLHKNKIKATDERLQEISHQANTITVTMLLIVSYIAICWATFYWDRRASYLYLGIIFIYLFNSSVRYILNKIL